MGETPKELSEQDADRYCQCPRRPGGVILVDDLKSMVHLDCRKAIRVEAEELKK